MPKGSCLCRLVPPARSPAGLRTPLRGRLRRGGPRFACQGLSPLSPRFARRFTPKTAPAVLLVPLAQQHRPDFGRAVLAPDDDGGVAFVGAARPSHPSGVSLPRIAYGERRALARRRERRQADSPSPSRERRRSPLGDAG